MKKNLPYLLLLSLLISQAAWAQKFVNRITIPTPISSMDTFMITIDTAMHNFNPNGGSDSTTNALVPTLCYNQTGGPKTYTYLGPTMIWNRGQIVTMDVYNNMTQRTTMHFHGLNLPSDMDGGPHEIIGSKSMWGGAGMQMPIPHFPIIDPVQTVWYHSHLMDSTTDQVALGLAGMMIIEETNDPVNVKLPRNYGKNDFPVVIQEKAFNFNPTTKKATSIKAGSKPGPGNLLMVNGLLYSVLHVPKTIIRLRLLNGSPISTLNIAINDSIAPVSYPNDSMWLVATDGGYTPQAFPMQTILIAPGERAEMLLNCSKYKQGDTVYMRSLAVPSGVINGPNNLSFMALVIDTNMKPMDPVSAIPTTLTPYPILDTLNAFKRRTKKLIGHGNGGNGQGPLWSIDSLPMNMELINDTILVGTSEIWTIKNTTNKAHPFHIHKVQFQVLDIKDTLGNTIASVYNNTLPKNMMGYKDDVLISAYTTLRFIAQFNHYGDDLIGDTAINVMDGFMYHCHILTHEDSAMMHQFVVLDTPSYNKITGKHIGIKKNVIEETANLSFYPNPAGNVLYIKGYTATKGSVRFIDILGRTIKEEKIAPINGTASIQVDDLPRGFVFVEYLSGNTRMIQKILLH